MKKLLPQIILSLLCGALAHGQVLVSAVSESGAVDNSSANAIPGTNGSSGQGDPVAITGTSTSGPTGTVTNPAGNPWTFSSAQVSTLQSITAISITLTIFDGDSGANQSNPNANFDFNNLTLGLGLPGVLTTAGGQMVDTGIKLNGFDSALINGSDITLTITGSVSNGTLSTSAAAALLSLLHSPSYQGQLSGLVLDSTGLPNTNGMTLPSTSAATLTITGVAVPEPGTSSLVIVALVAGAAWFLFARGGRQIRRFKGIGTLPLVAAASVLVASAARGDRNGNYVDGSTLNPPIKFSDNRPVRCPLATADGEPSCRCDVFGNFYVSGIRGFPAGVDLWYVDLNPNSPFYDPYITYPYYRGQPDGFTQQTLVAAGGDGGGDIDLAVGFGNSALTGTPILAYSSLIVANLSTGNSLDLAKTYNLNPVGNLEGGVAGDDREWMAAYGTDTFYLLYRTLDPIVGFVHQSKTTGPQAGGYIYLPATSLGTVGQTGGIDVDQGDGTVYCAFSDGRVAVGVPDATLGYPTSYTFSQAGADPNGVNHLFFTVKVAGDHTVYVVYSNDHDVYLSHSTDHGATWSPRVRVSNIPGGTNIFPWIEVSHTQPSTVGIAWFGTTNPANNDAADWNVYYAYTNSATSATPTFSQVKASDHVIHGANISEGGLTGGANRNLLDYMQVCFDPVGAAVLSFADDHNDYTGQTYLTRQTSGPSINGGNIPVPIPGSMLARPPGEAAPPVVPGPFGEQVTDYMGDVTSALLVRTGTPDPFDILSVKYSSVVDPVDGLSIVTSLKVSDLTLVPPAAYWRMHFTVNAPNSVLSPTGQFTFGVSDRGDQFYVEATTDPQGSRSYNWGTAVRSGDGTVSYTQRGTLNRGTFNPAGNTINLRIAASQLNQYLSSVHRPLIQSGTTLVGLRATCAEAAVDINDFNAAGQTVHRNGKRDRAYGGTQYTIP